VIHLRYIIKTNDPEVWNKITAWNTQGKLSIIDKGDAVESLKAKVEKIKESVDTIRKSGIDLYLLKVYIHSETGISRRDVDLILNAQDEFFKKLGVN
jgi:hypothetical protein